MDMKDMGQEDLEDLGLANLDAAKIEHFQRVIAAAIEGTVSAEAHPTGETEDAALAGEATEAKELAKWTAGEVGSARARAGVSAAGMGVCR